MRAGALTGETVSVGSTSVVLGDELNDGAEGTVYEIQRTSESVVKVFNEGLRDEKEPKIHEMLACPPDDPTADEKGIASIIWPTAVVTEHTAGSFLGYAMQRLPVDEHMDAQEYARNELAWDESTWNDRAKTALNLAGTVGMLHGKGHAMGDMNHQNILVRDGIVRLIDCDGFHISGRDEAAEYEGETVFPRYAPPEGRGDGLEGVRYADRFGLAIHIFQLLMEGNHPFAAVGSGAARGDYAEKITQNPFPCENSEAGKLEPPDRFPDYTALPSTVRDLFRTCFGYGKEYPKQRPRPEQWFEVLSAETDLSETGGSAGSAQWGSRGNRNRQRRGVRPAGTARTGPKRTVAGGNAASDWRDNVTANAGRAQSQPQRRSQSRPQPQSRSYLDAGRGLTVKTAKTAAIFLGYFVLFLVLGFAVLQFTPL